jgi:hypothetical protein
MNPPLWHTARHPRKVSPCHSSCKSSVQPSVCPTQPVRHEGRHADEAVRPRIQTRADDVTKAPKKKFPVLVDSGEFIPDSTFIRLHLEKKYGIDFDKDLSERDRGIAFAVEKMLEDNLYWAGMYERWVLDKNFDRGPKHFFDDIPQP